MGLGARRNVGSRSVNQGAQHVQEVTETQHVEDAVVASTPTEQPNTPATRTAGTPAVPANRGGNVMADMNAGILENIDDMNIGGNYVTMDGSEFLYKNTQETAKEIDIVVSYGKRFYQWFDEANNQYHNSETKLDDRYKMKFEIRWLEQGEDGDEPTEYTMTLPTASAMNFVNYVKSLATNGYRINQVITRLSISRQVAQSDSKIRYSRTEFENVGVLS